MRPRPAPFVGFFNCEFITSVSSSAVGKICLLSQAFGPQFYLGELMGRRRWKLVIASAFSNLAWATATAQVAPGGVSLPATWTQRFSPGRNAYSHLQALAEALNPSHLPAGAGWRGSGSSWQVALLNDRGLNLAWSGPRLGTSARKSDDSWGAQIGWLYFLPPRWSLTMSLGWRSLANRGTSEPLVMASISEDVVNWIRIYEPVYFGLGPQISYLFPLQSSRWPWRRHEIVAPEVGVGFGAYVLTWLSPQAYIEAKLMPWRGTASSRLFGLELQLCAGRTLG